MPVLIRSLARVFAGVLALGTFVVLGDATASSATGTNPTVTNVSPNTGPTTGGTAITITGTGFVAGATVVIGQGNGPFKAAAATNVNVVSSTEITATSGGGAIAGAFSLYVTTSGGTSAGNSGADFTYSPVGAAPTVTNVSPNTGPTSGGTTITITGTGFVPGSRVVIGQGEGTIGAIAATTNGMVSSTEITVTTGGPAKAGTFSLFVTSSGGTSAGNSDDDFTYSPVEFTASVRGITPNSGPTSGGTAITITGIFFASPATVVIGQGEGTVGAIAATNVVVVSSTEITATTGGGAKAGTFSLYVTTNNGVSSSSSRDDFTYESG